MNPVDVHGLAEVVLRLVVAALVGCLIGLNRDLKGKPAGVRTHGLVTLGAAVVTLATLSPGGVASDPNAVSRVIQGVLTGIGFLGAGVILRDAEGHVRGLTTAATVWIAAALGVICGLGYWQVVAVTMVIAFLVLLFGRTAERVGGRVFKDPRSHTHTNHDDERLT
jgi:putative Mg2+ transporter-C (MgtC) family protein